MDTGNKNEDCYTMGDNHDTRVKNAYSSKKNSTSEEMHVMHRE